MRYWQRKGFIEFDTSYVAWEAVKEQLKECEHKGYQVHKVLTLYENGKKYGKIILKA